MITVELPDGRKLEFPDGTDRETMKGAINRLAMRERVDAAKAGTLPLQPGSAERAASANALALGQANPRGPGQVIYDNLIGDPTDGVQSHGEALGTWLNRAGETMTLGLVGDEASAAVYAPVKNALSAVGLAKPATYSSELERFRENERNMSTMGRISADVTGAILPALTGVGLASSAATIPGAMARGAAIGGAQGGVMGFMEGEGDAATRGVEAVKSAGLGAALGGILAPIAGGVTSRAQQNSANNATIAQLIKGAPSTDELRAAGNAAYKAIDDAGVQIKPEAFSATRERILEALRSNTGFDELPGPGSLTPNTARVMEIMGQAGAKMADVPTAALPFKAVDQMRRQAGAAAGNVTNKVDARAGMEVIEGLDDFVSRLGPDDVVAGDVAALQSALPKAREIWSRMSKSQMLDDAIESGSGNYMGGAGSGIRNQFASILKNPKKARGLTKLEKAAMRRVVNGTLPENMINLFGGGLGQLSTMVGGAGLGGLPGLLAGAGTAAAARKASEAIVSRNAEIARALVAQGSKGAALPAISKTPRQVIEALIRRSGEVDRQ